MHLDGHRRWGEGAPSAAAARTMALALGTRVTEQTNKRRMARLAIVVVTDNRHSLVSIRKQGKRFELRVAWRLLDRADVVADAVVSWLAHGTFGDALRDAIAETPVPAPTARPEPILEPAGRHRDLAAILAEVAPLAGPAGAIAGDVRIGWARRSRPRRSLRLGSATPDHGAIRIHPALDDPGVPEYVVRMVVYHELCHCIAPPISRANARERGEPHRVHHAEFRALEALYPELERANRWVRDNFRQLLRY